MNKEVTLTISGLHVDAEAENGNVDAVYEGEYFKKNGTHYIIYEETAEGFESTSKSRIKCKDNMLELIRHGLLDTHMIFEKGKKHMTNYQTPYGQMLLGIDTKKLQVWETQQQIRIIVEYTLEVDEEYLSDSRIEIHIKNK